MCRRIVEYLYPLRGGSRPHLARCIDGDLYVVKLIGNPQGTSILINELLANRFAARIGLPVPNVEPVQLDPAVLAAVRLATPESRDVVTGPHIGIKFPVTHLQGRIYDALPRACFLRNPDAIPGAAVFDAWTANIDHPRQYVFWRHSREKKYNALLIDHGYCFGGSEWNMDRVPIPDTSGFCRELKNRKDSVDVEDVRQCIERWVCRIAALNRSDYEAAFYGIPPEWLQGRTEDFLRLPSQLELRSDKLSRQTEGPIYLDTRFTESRIACTELLP